MNILTLNALAITVLAALGLWIFARSASANRKKPDDKKDSSHRE